MDNPEFPVKTKDIAEDDTVDLPGTDREACGETTIVLPCNEDHAPAEKTDGPELEADGQPADHPAGTNRRRLKRQQGSGHGSDPTVDSGREEAACSVLFAIETAEAYRELHHRYGRGAEYLAHIADRKDRQRLAVGINRAIKFGLIRLELRPNWITIHRFFSEKRAKRHRKVT